MGLRRQRAVCAVLSPPFPVPAPYPPAGGLLPRRRWSSGRSSKEGRRQPPLPLLLASSSLSILFSLFLQFTTAARASRRSYAEEDGRRRGLRTSGPHLSRDDSRRSLPRSPMDTYLYRSRSVKQPGIKQALKGVKPTAKAAKGAIKGL
ncbi:hypothetical protein Taro_018647 [Colocasia esculenta]|uniref:Uncharacterized protein n=1 Tax=Colocasia esculenta TaxID=4460 RepID=A0A843URW8_COLES|nr:hypothetical protein [Colocasia esculenta]